MVRQWYVLNLAVRKLLKRCKERLDGAEVQSVAQYYMKLNGLGQVEYHYGVMYNFYTIYFIF